MPPATSRPYRICCHCIMDTSDPNIVFDDRGRCDYCNNYHQNILPNWHPDERGEREMLAEAEKIRSEGKGRDHDCIIGVSGGVDSSYATYLAKEKLGADGQLEFEPVKNDLARQFVAKAGEKEGITVPSAYLIRLERLAETEKLASDALLLGFQLAGQV